LDGGKDQRCRAKGNKSRTNCDQSGLISFSFVQHLPLKRRGGSARNIASRSRLPGVSQEVRGR
jgi:hypothetical protein